MPRAPEPTVSRVVRLRLDGRALSGAQVTGLERHAGTARAVWNWGLAARNAQHDALMGYVRRVAAEQGDGDDERAAALMGDAAWRAATIKAAPDELRKPLRSAALGKRFTAEARVADSRFAWWKAEDHGVNRFAVSSSLQALDAAFERYYKNTGGHRGSKRSRPRKDGRPAAWPRFKKRGRATDAFAIFNLVVKGQDPWRIVDGAHRVKVPSLGTLRVHENTRRLRRLIRRGGVPKSARFSRSGGYWYVAIVVAMPEPGPRMVMSPSGAVSPATPDRRQRDAGVVGVDLGIKTLATLSTGAVVENPRVGRAAARRIGRLQRRLSRQQEPTAGTPASRGWLATKSELGRVQHKVAMRRRGTIHELTKRLAADHTAVAIEDLNVRGMTSAPAAIEDPDHPGTFLANGAAAKSGLNRAILDVGFGEFRRQLTYKTSWYGSLLVPVARFAPTSKTCSACGTVKAKLRLSERTFTCGTCGLVIDRDLNAARNIAALGMQALGNPSPADAGDAKRPDVRSRPGAPAIDLVRQDLGPPRSQRPATDLSPTP